MDQNLKEDKTQERNPVGTASDGLKEKLNAKRSAKTYKRYETGEVNRSQVSSLSLNTLKGTKPHEGTVAAMPPVKRKKL